MVVHNGHIGASAGGVPANGNSHCVEASGYSVSYMARSPYADSVDVDMDRMLDRPRELHRGSHNSIDGSFVAESPLQFSAAGHLAKRYSLDRGASRYDRRDLPGQFRHHVELLRSSNGVHDGVDEDMLDPASDARRGISSGDRSLNELPTAMQEETGLCRGYPRHQDPEDGEDHRPRFYHLGSKEENLSARTVGQDAKLYDRKLWLQREQELYVQAMRLKRT
ncbi:hypothetical protein RRG08_037884 [Elysia crispata]|uniref:Uncharacterized protein n=1 Tax=Elysia crispata TaxID=231223 RepID=A0AAE0ZK99_9GAST|nr:hypothetical protein RRG08_037884 [Elysia crispata]